MAFEKTVPEWNAQGTEPPSSLKTNGFQAGYKPPAAYFNWFWYSVSQCLKELQEKSPDKYGMSDIVEATSTDGIAYTATVDGVTELTVGMQITIIPNMLSQSTSPTLNVNGLGAKGLRALTGYGTSTCVPGAFTGWLSSNKPATVKYNGTYWVVTDVIRASGASIYGKIPVQNGGWYSNTETTDDDKAEALEAFLKMGLSVPFVAKYGTTTSAEIEAAYQAGKTVLCKNEDAIGVLFARATANSHFFLSGTTVYRCFNDTWSDVSTLYTFKPSSHASSHATGGSDAIAATDIGAVPSVNGATSGNLPTFNTSGNIVDSGKKPSDFATKSKAVTMTLSSASWSGTEAPYTITLSVTGVTAASNQEILPGLDITAEQIEALQSANIQDGGQAVDSITLKAFGDKPEIDIPIRIILRGDA